MQKKIITSIFMHSNYCQLQKTMCSIFVFLYISDLFYFVVNKKVKIQSHELNSLHHSLKKKQHKITNHITKNRIGKYSNHINSPLMLSNPPTAHLPTTDPVKL